MLKRDYGECYVYSAFAHLNISCRISYRFRLVSISCDPNFTFSIDGHNMTVIEVEGTNVQPLLVDSIQIFAGMRESHFLPHCTNQ